MHFKRAMTIGARAAAGDCFDACGQAQALLDQSVAGTFSTASRQTTFFDLSGRIFRSQSDVLDVDGQCGCCGVAIGVLDRIGKDILNIVCDEVGLGYIGVAAIGVECECAVGAGDGGAYAVGRSCACGSLGHADHCSTCIPSICARFVVGQHIAAHAGAFADCIDVAYSFRRVVNDSDVQRLCVRVVATAVSITAVLHRDRE